MFSGCENLAEINLLFQTKMKKLNDISYMFQNCVKIKEIDLTNFDTNLVTDMTNLFKNCKKLKNMNGLNNLDTSNANDMENMFQNC